jgi:hypothetical protein
LVDIELADAVAVGREELLEAARRGVGPIEMEFAVELRAHARANDWIEALA